MPPKTRAAARKTRRKDRKNVTHGHAYIKSTFNNTIVSLTDPQGAVIAWCSSGQVGFKGSRKSTPYAAQLAAEAAASIFAVNSCNNTSLRPFKKSRVCATVSA